MGFANFVPFIGGVISSVVNAIHADRQQNKQNAFNEAMIDKQNQYNSPEAIINRMVTSGIPLKAAQKSLSGVPTAGEQTNVASSAPNNFDAAQSFANVYLAMAQAQNLRADAALKSEDARGKQIDNENKQQGYEDAHQLAQDTLKNSQVSRRSSESQMQLNDKQAHLLDLSIEHGELENQHYAKILPLELRQKAAEVDLTDKELAYVIATYDDRVNLSRYETKKLSADIQQVISETKQIKSILAINAPDEIKANLLAEYYRKHPDAVKIGAILGDKTSRRHFGLSNIVKSIANVGTKAITKF